MVLARKKMKQKLRTILPAGEAEGEGKVKVEVEAIKERLVSSKRPRPKRAKKPSPKKPPKKPRLTEEEFREEVERKREERRKEKKEKRRLRRLMEAEAGGKRMGEEAGEGDSSDSEEGDSSESEDEAAAAEEEEDKAGAAEGEAAVEQVKPRVADRAAVGSGDSIVVKDSEQNVKKVYVGGIPYYSTEDDIRSFFEGCGSITALDCMRFPETGKFRGIAIITFKTDAAAQRALALDGAEMGEFYLKIQPYESNREKEDYAPKMIEGYNRVYVGNLAWDITEADLRNFFSDCKISYIRFGKDKETGDFKGYAHVDFSDGTSLAVAMKLDQKVIKGRPVRIRCAVPKKDNQKPNDNANLDSLKNKIRSCYECGMPGHISSFCANKKVSEVISDEKNANVDSAAASSKKRRTCYECGLPGHLSSACPNKKAVDTVSSYKGHDIVASEVIYDEKNANVDSATTSSKKRRTCYECGVPGHLSSACPNKKPVDTVSSYKGYGIDTKAAPYNISEEDKIVDESNSAASKKRRKCYECGISGHLSSACPNKKATVISDLEKPYVGSSTTPAATYDDGNKATDDTKPAPPKKKKRRTCYECGIAGHLSSECPNKAAAEVK